MKLVKPNSLRLGRSYTEFRLFWRSLGLKPRLQILAAIGVTFSSVGFISDIVSYPRYRPFRLLAVAAAAAGLMAVLMAVLSFRSRRGVLAAALVFAAGAFLIVRSTAPTLVWSLPFDQAAFTRRLSLDAGAVMLCSMLGYALFLTFIGNEGFRQVRYATEMALARTLQEALVPPIDTTVAGLQFYGRSVPSEDVGGDLLDLWHDGETASVYVADVSGHGVAAGAMMGMAKSAIRVQLLMDRSLDRLFENLNDVLVDLTPINMYLTLVSVRFRAERTEICSAGHLPVLWYSRQAGRIERLQSQQIPIAFLKETDYCCTLVPRTDGDLFVLLTDGITETRNAAGELFGLERVEAVIRRMPDAPLPEIYQAVIDAARAFGPTEDDRTLLLVRT